MTFIRYIKVNICLGFERDSEVSGVSQYKLYQDQGYELIFFLEEFPFLMLRFFK